MSKIMQFWRTQVTIFILLTFLSVGFIFFSYSYLSAIPRNGIPFVATIFSTLLGLTFTAFAIIGAFMPNIEKDFLSTRTFENFFDTFKVTMTLELISLTLCLFYYVTFSGPYSFIFMEVLTGSSILSLGFMAYLINKTFKVFKIARRGLLNL